MVAVDTNVMVRLAMRDDAKQTDAAARFVANGAWVPLVVTCETIWVLQRIYAFAKTEITNYVEALLQSDVLTLQDADVVERSLALFRSRGRLSFNDCVVLEIARKAGHVPLGTFDKALSKIEGAKAL